MRNYQKAPLSALHVRRCSKISTRVVLTYPSMYPRKGWHCDRSRTARFDLDVSSRCSVWSLAISSCCSRNSLNPVAGRVARALARAWLVPGSTESRHGRLDQVTASCASAIVGVSAQLTINRRDGYRIRRRTGELRRGEVGGVVAGACATVAELGPGETAAIRTAQNSWASVNSILSCLGPKIWE